MAFRFTRLTGSDSAQLPAEVQRPGRHRLSGIDADGKPRNAEFSRQNEKEYAWFKISDSLPVGSIGAKGAARKIIRALISGDAEVHLGVASKVGALAQGLAPGLVTDVLGSVDKYLMPDPAPRQPDPQKGSASESEASENILTQLTREAEVQNNQI